MGFYLLGYFVWVRLVVWDAMLLPDLMVWLGCFWAGWVMSRCGFAVGWFSSGRLLVLGFG